MLERELAELLEGTAAAAFAVDLQGEVRTWNKAAEIHIQRTDATIVSGTPGATDMSDGKFVP